MCGRYRLSRRKQTIHEYFDTAESCLVAVDVSLGEAFSPYKRVARQERHAPRRVMQLISAKPMRRRGRRTKQEQISIRTV